MVRGDRVQLLPPAPLERLRLRATGLPSYALGLWVGGGGGSGGRYVPSQASRPSLLSVLVTVATSHSESGPPDLPGVPRGDAPGGDPRCPKRREGHAARSRRGRGGVPVGDRARVVEGSSVRLGGRRASARRRARRGPRGGRAHGWVADRLPFDEWATTRWPSSRTRTPGERGLRPGPPTRRRRGATGLAGLLRPDRAGRGADPPASVEKLLVTATRWRSARREMHGVSPRPTKRSRWNVILTWARALQDGYRRLGQALDRARGRTPARRHGDLHRCKRGLHAFPDRWARSRVLRARLGRGVRVPGTEHVNTYRQGGDARVYWADPPLPARPRLPEGSPLRQRSHPRRREPYRLRSACWT